MFCHNNKKLLCSVLRDSDGKRIQLTFSVSRFASGRRMTRRFKACSCCFLVGRSADRWKKSEVFTEHFTSFFHFVRKKVIWHKHHCEMWDTTTEQQALLRVCLWGISTSSCCFRALSLECSLPTAIIWRAALCLQTHNNALKIILASAW